MNEMIFFLHALLVVAAVLGAVRLGREALVTLVTLCAVVSNLFVLKQIHLFGLDVTCSDVYAIGGMLGLNLLREYHGVKLAKRAVWVALAAGSLFALLSMIQIAYRPSTGDWAHEAFSTLLSPMPRLLIASLAVYFLVQRIDLRLYGWLKKHFPNSSLALRSFFSIALSQLLDTILFSFAGLYGMVDSILSIILVSYTIKFITIALLAPFTTLSKRLNPISS